MIFGVTQIYELRVSFNICKLLFIFQGLILNPKKTIKTVHIQNWSINQYTTNNNNFYRLV